jgi:hypothetical protein
MNRVKIEGIVFDDFEISNDEQINRYTQVCQGHSTHFVGSNARLSDCAGEPFCGVEGCDKNADYYLDFVDCEVVE